MKMYKAGTINTLMNYYQPTHHYVLERHELQCSVVLTNCTEGIDTAALTVVIPSSPRAYLRLFIYFTLIKFIFLFQRNLLVLKVRVSFSSQANWKFLQ